MAVIVAWSSFYLQLSSFNFLMSGLFGDILCLRFFLTFAYLFLFINAITGFPNLGELATSSTEDFILHYDVLVWSSITLYVHFSKFMGILLNEKEIRLPEESIPLWRMLYRNGGLSQLLFKQYIYPSKFQVVKFKAGTEIPTDNCLYIILDGVADTQITLQRGDGFADVACSPTSAANSSPATPKAGTADNKSPRNRPNSGTKYSKKKMEFDEKMSNASSTSTTMSQRNLLLTSGEMINIKVLQLFRAGTESEAFANQTVNATAVTDMTLYRISDVDVISMAKTPQTKNAYQGLLIYALTGVAEREIMISHFCKGGSFSEYNTRREKGPDGRDFAFQPLEDWEEPNPLISGSGKALTMPIRHFASALKTSFRPPWPIIRWIPGLRHAALPAPHLCPPEDASSSVKDTISTLTQDYDNRTGERALAANANETNNYGSTDMTPLVADPRGMEVEDGSAKHHSNESSGRGYWFFGRK
jgi:hypothetical protein